MQLNDWTELSSSANCKRKKMFAHLQGKKNYSEASERFSCTILKGFALITVTLYARICNELFQQSYHYHLFNKVAALLKNTNIVFERVTKQRHPCNEREWVPLLKGQRGLQHSVKLVTYVSASQVMIRWLLVNLLGSFSLRNHTERKGKGVISNWSNERSQISLNTLGADRKLL